MPRNWNAVVVFVEVCLGWLNSEGLERNAHVGEDLLAGDVKLGEALELESFVPGGPVILLEI